LLGHGQGRIINDKIYMGMDIAWTSCLFLNIVRVIYMNVYIDMERTGTWARTKTQTAGHRREHNGKTFWNIYTYLAIDTKISMFMYAFFSMT
jgi:hypothetical protein